jgi:pantoate--beta-alanine ligase
MDMISTIPELRQRLSVAGRIAFVPTMGNLHAGHLSLVQMAKEKGDCVVVSIFVNPLQFGPNEDLANYPRTLQADCEQLQAAGADVLFTPTEAVLYPTPQTVQITPPPIASDLCGKSRPDHFQGVCTVVAKLFNIVQPAVALFGSKDYQQFFILKEMAKQLDIPVDMIGCPTVRETDGLAMSSRNGYLKPAERLEAPRLYRALQQVMLAVQQGRRDFAAIESQTNQYLTQLGWIVDYVTIRSVHNLLPPRPEDNDLIVLAAAKLGRTRLIDNIEFCAMPSQAL